MYDKTNTWPAYLLSDILPDYRNWQKVLSRTLTVILLLFGAIYC